MLVVDRNLTDETRLRNKEVTHRHVMEVLQRSLKQEPVTRSVRIKAYDITAQPLRGDRWSPQKSLTSGPWISLSFVSDHSSSNSLSPVGTSLFFKTQFNLTAFRSFLVPVF